MSQGIIFGEPINQLREEVERWDKVSIVIKCNGNAAFEDTCLGFVISISLKWKVKLFGECVF